MAVLVAPSTKEQIVTVAERLFALHGIDGVSLRQIGSAAGNGNNSAVQYHFGSKDRLVQAIFEYRLPGLHRRRTLLISERRPDSLRSWVECQVRVVMEQSELEGSHYLGFVAMLRRHGRRDDFDELPSELRHATREFHLQLGSFLSDLPEPLRARRMARANVLIILAGADRERDHAAGRKVAPFALEVADLVDAVVGLLNAPVSPTTLGALADVEPATADWLFFP